MPASRPAGSSLLRLALLCGATIVGLLPRGGSQAVEKPTQPLMTILQSDMQISNACCALYDKSDDAAGLMHCSLNVSSHLADHSKNLRNENSSPTFDITIVSYLTSDIAEYGAYSLALSNMFAEYHNYSRHVVTSEKGNSIDERWSKVGVMLEFLTHHHVSNQRQNSIDSQAEYALWLDSDVVFLDIGMRLEDLVIKYPQYDMIFSADSQDEMGIANSGIFLVKNTEWSREFLTKWLKLQTPSATSSHAANSDEKNSIKKYMMDQLAFDKLYHSLLPDITSHIVILPPDALNSRFPAWTHQLPSNQVLHLAATSALLRRRVFAQAFGTMCNHIRVSRSCVDNSHACTSSQLPQQLGLSKEELLSIRHTLPVEDVVLDASSSLQRATCDKANGNSTMASHPTEGGFVLKQLSKIEDAFRHNVNIMNIDDMHQNLIIALDCTYKVFMKDSNNNSKLLSQLRLLLAISFRYSLMIYSNKNQRYFLMDALFWVDTVIDEALLLARSNSLNVLPEILYYKYKHLFMTAELSDGVGEGNEWRALGLYERAMQVWWERHGYYTKPQYHNSAKREHIDPHSEAFETLYRLAVLSCDAAFKGHETHGIGNVTLSLKFNSEVWEGVSMSHLPEQVLVMMGKTWVAGGDCHRRLNQVIEAEEHYRHAREILQLVQLPFYREQISSLLSYLDKSIDLIDGARVDMTAETGLHYSTKMTTSSNVKRVFRRRKKSDL